MVKPKFNPAFNSEIYRTVKSFNQKAKRAEARGVKNTPDIVSIAKLKARYQTEEDMKVELARLRKFNNNPSALNRVNLGYESSTTEWELGYIKDSLSDVKDMYDIMIKAAKDRVKTNPNDYSVKQQLANLEVRRQYLDRNIYDLTRSELKTFKRYIGKYQDYGTRDAQFQNTFMDALDAVMESSNADTATLSRIRNQLSELTPEEFMELYNSSPELRDLFYEVDSPEGLKRLAYSRKQEAREKYEKELEKVEASDKDRMAKWRAEGWKEDPETGQWYKPGEWIKDEDGMWVNAKNKATWKMRDTSEENVKLVTDKLTQVDVFLEDRIATVKKRMNVKMPKGLTPRQQRLYNKYKKRK